jgi:hypothetical protein
MEPSEVLFTIVAGLVALGVASRGFRVDKDYVARWASSANVELTDESRRVVRRYLTWSRRCRTAGGLAGFLAPVITSAVSGRPDDPGPWAVALMVVGYLLGALLAEVINRPERGSGTALLIPRRLDDYLPAYVLVLQRGLAILSILMVPTYALLEPHAPFSSPSVAGAAAFGVAGGCIAVIIEGLQRRIVARRQPITRAADLSLDDAMRASSMHVLAGAGVALLIYIASLMVAISITTVTPEPVSTAIGVAFLLLVMPSSIFLWVHLAQPHGFRVRRDEKLNETRGVST